VTQESWSAYWRLGEPTTLNFFREGYTGELAEFWHPLVDALPEGARVVDMATGNGAVAVVVLRRARSLGRTLTIEGVDVAQIDPVTHAGKLPRLREDLQAIQFHPGTPLERTGLPGAAYDLVTSQYGIEYGDVAAAVAEIARLLRPGGRFGAILHSTDSNVARTATHIDRLLTLLLDELEIPARVRRLVAALGAVRDRADLARSRHDEQTRPLWIALEQATGRAQAFSAHDEEMRGTTHGFLQQILAPLNDAIRLASADKLALIEQVETKSRNLQRRMTALHASALDPAGLDRFTDRLRAVGLIPEPAQSIRFGARHEAMGYGVVARRG
jgi:SAM-dependent methyltransferase